MRGVISPFLSKNLIFNTALVIIGQTQEDFQNLVIFERFDENRNISIKQRHEAQKLRNYPLIC